MYTAAQSDLKERASERVGKDKVAVCGFFSRISGNKSIFCPSVLKAAG